MMRMVYTAAALFAAYMVVQSLPDIARYLKIREM